MRVSATEASEDAMKHDVRSASFTLLLGALAVVPQTRVSLAQAPQPPADHPAVTVRGQTYTPRSVLARNMGSPEDQTTAFTPHRIIDNIYYVGTKTLSSFLVVTPSGNILIDSTYERNVPVIEKSVSDLGFKFSEVKIVLGNHAHGDHQEGDALVKQKTGALVMAMAEDVPALQAMKPGGKEHPIDRVLHDGDKVRLGGKMLVAHLTPGHTRGCTTWTTTAEENGKTSRECLKHFKVLAFFGRSAHAVKMELSGSAAVKVHALWILRVHIVRESSIGTRIQPLRRGPPFKLAELLCDSVQRSAERSVHFALCDLRLP
jgi:Metallo-beta-lactamase superfamily